MGAIWAAVSYGAAIGLADCLDEIKMGGFPLGFWFANRVFWKRATKEGAIAAMISDILFTGGNVVSFRGLRPDLDLPAHRWLGISPEGIGSVGMLLASAVQVAVSLATKAPPQEVQDLVASLRHPRAAAQGPAALGARRVLP